MINRQLLFYKLLKYGITGHVYHVIKSMYDDTRYRVKIRDRYSPSFRGTSGVKQGCSMSPILSNMYQNDLHSIFTEGCDPVQLGETSINSISWADDLLLLSSSKRGLQNCLNDLKSYCYKWGLQSNSSKTKCMILTKQTYRSDKFEFHNTNLECVRSFNYLGFQISYNGKFRRIIDDRVSKAGKTGNMVLQAIKADFNVSVKLPLSLFDKQICSILLYGSAVWSLPNHQNLIYLTNQNEDQRPREIASEFTYNALGRNVPIIFARRVGKTSDAQNRRVLIRLKHYNDVLELIQSPNNGNVVEFQHFHDTKDSAIEMVHKNFLKKSLNISKHASNTCIYKELKRCPVTHRAWAMAIKYWIRLNSGTENCLLNEAYKMSQAEWPVATEHSLFA